MCVGGGGGGRSTRPPGALEGRNLHQEEADVPSKSLIRTVGSENTQNQTWDLPSLAQ